MGIYSLPDGLSLIVCLLVISPVSNLPNELLIYGGSFLTGCILFTVLRTYFEKFTMLVGLISLALFMVAAVTLPFLGKSLGDKAGTVGTDHSR